MVVEGNAKLVYHVFVFNGFNFVILKRRFPLYFRFVRPVFYVFCWLCEARETLPRNFGNHVSIIDNSGLAWIKRERERERERVRR